MQLHIGEIIQRKIKEKRFTLKEFANYMDMSYRNAQDFVKRDVINTTQLQKASEFLDEDLTVYFKPKISSNQTGSDPTTSYNAPDDLKMYVVLKGSYDNMPRFRDMIKEVNDVTAKYGFSMMT